MENPGREGQFGRRFAPVWHVERAIAAACLPGRTEHGHDSEKGVHAMNGRWIRRNRRWWIAACGAAAAVVLGVDGAKAQSLRSQRFARDRATAGTPAGAAIPQPSPRPAPAVRIDWRRELLITDLSVVEDPIRTRPPRRIDPTPVSSPRAAGPISASAGKWTFGRLMRAMAGPNDPSEFVLRWLELWEQDQVVNGFVSRARPNIRSQVIQPWLDASGGQKLDLDKAPFRLLAIVNRMDLRQNPAYAGSNGNAGEGRFVFGVLGPNGNPLSFTVILEYKLPAKNAQDIKAWANRWHALGSLNFGPQYNAALEAVTDLFAGRNADPSRPNGSSIGQIRTNEIGMGPGWQLREFVIDPATGMLKQTTTKQSPDQSFNGTQTLADWINANESVILAERHTVPAQWLAAEDPESFTWNAPGINNPDARHKFALNTCSGCHFRETGTSFTMVGVRQAGVPTRLSGFITGTTVNDPVTGQPRNFNDIQRRVEDFRRLLQARRFDVMLEAPATRRVH